MNSKGLIRKFTDMGYTNKKKIHSSKPSLIEYSKMTTVPIATSTLKLQTAEYKVGIQARETTRHEIMKTSRITI